MDNDDFTVPKVGEELIHVQQRILYHLDELFDEFFNLFNLANKTEQLCDINDAAWVNEEKSYMINLLNKSKVPETELPPTKPEMLLTVLYKIKQDQELQLTTQEILEDQIENLEEKIHNAELVLAVQRKNSKTLRTDNARRKNDIGDWDLQTKKSFQIYRKYLHTFLERNFNTINLKNLVQDLTIAFFNRDDKYVDVANRYTYTEIEILKQASLIMFHKNDLKKIKFIDI